ncbi:TetR/AcrR family transcriptional regulator [Polyangium jinanense]|uniref:TetR family transcriptional regulator n=1 Tax=Polyangium jinanense TaxID=2829994 RepID=A0A9X4AWA8_9BACT|nr:TetR family transcriptional regulator [Polyangium jinanense]MDC3955916.1 TetR family transcriptional regulator [Polyangium jinanense]MDC3983275.1 TetR family transcriptional regulator [Polyangium jinanense]MDC3985145.1 TetR family transcriptional regulator [Polyangium jinanense]
MTAGTAATDTRSRLLDTALKLFSEHGVEGTSLQMIADELGVTKAAVYYHFKTKDEITEAVAAPGVQELDQIIEEARALRSRGAQIDHALSGFVELIVRQRSLLSLYNSDPGIQRVINRAFRTPRGEDVKTRMKAVLAGENPSLADAIAVHVVFTGLAMVGGAPEYAGIDDDTLREHLLEAGRRLLGRPRRKRPDNHLPGR